MSAHKTVIIKGEPLRKEAAASATITPGMLIEWDGSGALQPHGTADGAAAARFAREEDFVGDDIDTTYASGDTVQYFVAHKGDEVNALVATGQTLVKGSPLFSNGDGTLKTATVTATTLEGALVAYSLEAVTTSGTTRVQVEVA